MTKNKKSHTKPLKKIPKNKNRKEEPWPDEELLLLYEAILVMSKIICDSNDAFERTMRDYLQLPLDDFISKYEELDRELALRDTFPVLNPTGILTPKNFAVDCVHILSYYGFVSSNDVKFTLADVLYNLRRSLAYYNISEALFDAIPGKDERMIEENIHLIAELLPCEYKLLHWQIDGDEYNFFILRARQTPGFLQLAESMDPATDIHITAVDPVHGLRG